MRGQPAEIEWTGEGVPVSARFTDPYYSLGDGLAETRHVFLAGNQLPGRFAEGFHMAELGFGTGLTLLTALLSWRAQNLPGRLRFTSFEAFPMPVEDMARALQRFPEAASVAGPLLDAMREGHQRLVLDDLDAEIVLGDARQTLAGWDGRADAWCLDGFAPARNPEMWEDGLLAEVARHTTPGGTFATYTAAGHVRRALAAAGFEVERVPGYGRKRHMTVGRLR